MKTFSTAVAGERSASFRAILVGGLIAGLFDITYAIVVSNILLGLRPITVLQSVSSGLLGSDAYDGGLATAVLGTFLHFLIALTAAAVYHLASRKLPFLIRHAIVFGLLYGVAIYLFMYFIVLPLSAFPHKLAFTPAGVMRNLAIHMLGIGLPISIANRRYSGST